MILFFCMAWPISLSGWLASQASVALATTNLASSRGFIRKPGLLISCLLFIVIGTTPPTADVS
jgi:hypothetical protein